MHPVKRPNSRLFQAYNWNWPLDETFLTPNAIIGSVLAFGPLFLIVYLDRGINMYLCGCVLIYILCMLYYCASDITVIMQSAAPIRWHPSMLWDYQCYD